MSMNGAVRCAAAPLLAAIAATAFAQPPAASSARRTLSPELEALNPPVPADIELAEGRRRPAEQSAAANVDPKWAAPRTSWGHPSLQGTWSTDDMRGIPVDRPEALSTQESLGEREFVERAKRQQAGSEHAANVQTFHRVAYGSRVFGFSSLVVDPPNGRTPALTPDGRARAAVAASSGSFGPGPFDTFEDFSLYDRCIARGLSAGMTAVLYGNGIVIAQSPDSVTITYEMVHETRVIPLDGRPHLDTGVAQYNGNSRGHFDGDTLVVETSGFTDKTSIGSGAPNSARLRTTERIRRVDPQMIEYRVTVDDPATYTAPFTVRTIWTGAARLRGLRVLVPRRQLRRRRRLERRACVRARSGGGEGERPAIAASCIDGGDLRHTGGGRRASSMSTEANEAAARRMKPLLEDAARRAAEYLASLPERQVAPDPEAVRRLSLLDVPLQHEPHDAQSVLAELDELVSPATMAMAGPRFFGFVIGGSLPAALAANWLAGAWDQNAGLYSVTPGVAHLEQVALRWLVDLLGLPRRDGGRVRDGRHDGELHGARGGTSCRAAARRLERRGRRLVRCAAVTVIVSAEVHITVLEVARHARPRPHARRARAGRMRRDACAPSELPRIDGPTIVCVQAGNVNTGCVRSARAGRASVRTAAGAWVHVDGAFGLWARTLAPAAHLVQGIEQADSWSTDAHKWLNVPYDSGIAFVRDGQALAVRDGDPGCRTFRPRRSQRNPFDLHPGAVAPRARRRRVGRAPLARPQRRRRADRAQLRGTRGASPSVSVLRAARFSTTWC